MKSDIIWAIIRCRHLENKLKTCDECFPQPCTDENNGMEFLDCCMWQGSPWQQFYWAYTKLANGVFTTFVSY
jgi:hypothetical protein